MPLITAAHRIITDACRRNKGDLYAPSEAFSTAERAVRELLRTWPSDQGVKVHVLVQVEYPRGAKAKQ